MKTSARNQFPGKVSNFKRGAVNDEIELELAGGQKIAAIVTHASTERLGLGPGAQAFALVNASSVIVVVDDESVKFSARNLMRGTVSRLQTGAVNTEVVIELGAGSAIVAIISNESSDTLGLAVGARAAGMFKASSVILGVAVQGD